MLALKDPPSMKGSKSLNNLARSYAQFQQVQQGKTEPFSIYRAKRDPSKSTNTLNDSKTNDFSDYTLVGNKPIFASGKKIGAPNANATRVIMRSKFLQNLQRHQEDDSLT